MVAEYVIERSSINGQAKVVIPAFVRDSVFHGVKKVRIEVSQDSGGKFIIIRPLNDITVVK